MSDLDLEREVARVTNAELKERKAVTKPKKAGEPIQTKMFDYSATSRHNQRDLLRIRMLGGLDQGVSTSSTAKFLGDGIKHPELTITVVKDRECTAETDQPIQDIQSEKPRRIQIDP